LRTFSGSTPDFCIVPFLFIAIEQSAFLIVSTVLVYLFQGVYAKLFQLKYNVSEVFLQIIFQNKKRDDYSSKNEPFRTLLNTP